MSLGMKITVSESDHQGVTPLEVLPDRKGKSGKGDPLHIPSIQK